jgi:lipoprotein-releasing system permease protein
MMFIILSLIVAVAAFNIVSTLVMAVTDKQADIAILRTLGASPRQIMAIFIVQGAADRRHRPGAGRGRRACCSPQPRRGRAGMEKLLGTTFCVEGGLLHQRPAVRPAGLRRGEHRHHRFRPALVATLYPSWRASRVNPAEALRYE